MALTAEQQELARDLRKALEQASDEQLDKFLAGYALGRIAGLLVEYMNPEQRMGFVTSIRRTYPEAFAKGSA